jgi:glycosyltransferase involved in cell wall biosynthesis
MRIHQVLATAAPEDATTNSCFELRALLRRTGPSDLFARNIHHELAGEVVPLAEYDRHVPRPSRDDIILLHLSIGEPDLFSFLLERPERVILIYRNISPAALYLQFDPAFASLLEDGRQELAALRDRVVLALADSSYNADELVGLGYADVRVSRLVVDPRRLQSVVPDEAASRRLAGLGGPVLLFVGQLLPHKRPDLLLKAFHILITYLVPDARLLMVGNSQRLPAYRKALERFRDELNLQWALIDGSVSDPEFVAYYRRADVFVTASEHEGFCVPLLEAMAFEVPIVARAHAAIPETLGDAGLLLPPDDDPALLAEALAELIRNAALRRELIGRGRARLDEFDPDTARAAVLQHVLSVA